MGKRKKNRATQQLVDWSQMPKELLQLIAKRLDSELYILRFRSVCSMWRSSITNPSPNTNMNNTSAFPFYKRNIFLIKPPLHQQQQQQNLRPWLIKFSQVYSHGQTHHLIPFSRASNMSSYFPHMLVDFNQLPVLDLGCEFVFSNSTFIPVFSLLHVKVVSTKWQGKEPLGFLAFNLDGQLALFCCDDDRWTLIPNNSPTWTWTTDICVFKGRLYAVDSNGQTVTVGLDSSVHLVAEPVFGGGTKFLVESEGDLLLVDKYSPNDCNIPRRYPIVCYDDNDNDGVDSDGSVVELYGVGQRDAFERDMRFNVFRLEEEEKKWVELTSLGDMVLFLMDDCSFSISASTLCAPKGNCVIYSHRYDDFDIPNFKDFDMSIFHLDQGLVLPLSDYLSYSNLFWPPPDWARLRRRHNRACKTYLH